MGKVKSIVDGMRVAPELVGLTSLLTDSMRCSGGRSEMWAAHCGQARPVIGSESANMFTGFESLFGDYTFNSAECEHDVKVVKVINKFNIGGYNPLRTVIYRDLETGEISYFNLRRYSSYSNDYGYENVMKRHITEGDVISANSELYSSPSKDGDTYKMGVNANVAFMTLLETTEDLFPISESFAKRLSPLSIETKKITVDLKKYPLNLNGDTEDYKIFPDIGDLVRPDGVLCAWRPSRKFSMMYDLHPSKLTSVNYLFDQRVYAHPGSKVIDVDVYLNSRANIPTQPYAQVRMYHEASLSYYQQIVNVYEQCATIPISNKFNTLVTKAMGMLLAAKRYVPNVGKNSKIQLMDKFASIELRIDITLAHQVIVNNGFKTTGREGGKGVVVIVPDHMMPVDEQGFRADICVDPVSVLKRTNVIQLYEQYLNRLLKWEAMRLAQFGDEMQQFDRIIEILNDIHPAYAKVVFDVHKTAASKIEFVNECKADTIKVCIPPGYDGLTTELIAKLEAKYQCPISRVTFGVNTPDGVKMVTSKHPIRIGSKYMFLLAKYPKSIASGLGHVNHFHYPINSSDKKGTPIGSMPIRFGEDESRMLTVAVGAEQVVRLRGLYGVTNIGPEKLLGALLDTPQPSKLGRVPIETAELADNDFAVRVAHHMLNTAGIDMESVIMTDQEAAQTFVDLKQLED